MPQDGGDNVGLFIGHMSTFWGINFTVHYLELPLDINFRQLMMRLSAAFALLFSSLTHTDVLTLIVARCLSAV